MHGCSNCFCNRHVGELEHHCHVSGRSLLLQGVFVHQIYGVTLVYIFLGSVSTCPNFGSPCILVCLGRHTLPFTWANRYSALQGNNGLARHCHSIFLSFCLVGMESQFQVSTTPSSNSQSVFVNDFSNPCYWKMEGLESLNWLFLFAHLFSYFYLDSSFQIETTLKVFHLSTLLEYD